MHGWLVQLHGCAAISEVDQARRQGGFFVARNPPLRLFCGCGSSPGARTLARDAVCAHAYISRFDRIFF